jgi:hypothetical protein
MQIKKKQFKRLIAEIQQSVEWVDDLNCGGCGVFAAIVAKRFNKIGIPAVVRIGAWNAPSNSNAVKDTYSQYSRPKQSHFRSNGVSFDHLIVEIPFGGNIYHMDSICFHSAEPKTRTCSAPIYDGNLDVATALRIAKTKDWNRCFDRKQIPNLIKSVNDVFDSFVRNNK